MKLDAVMNANEPRAAYHPRMVGWIGRGAIGMLVIAAACTSTPSAVPPGSASAPASVAASDAGAGKGPAQPVTLSVAQFNTDISDEYPTITAASVADAIRASGADVVGIEEGGGEVPDVAKALGWAYYDVRTQIVSRLPLRDPPDGAGVYTFVEPTPGHVVAMINVHLPSDPYGPYWVRDGRSPDQVLALERRVRLSAIEPKLPAAKALQARGIPVFLTGDFNSPSFHDWTQATVGTRRQIRYPVDWPATAAVEAAGFRDSFRVVNPDPVAVPGITWPTHRTLKGVWNPSPREPLDRIDFVFATPDARPTESRIVGEPGAPGTSATVAPWPSDHRLVVSTFTVAPAPAPTFVTLAHRSVTVGDAVQVAYHVAGGTAERIEVVPAGAPATSPAPNAVTVPAGAADGSAGFDSGSLAPGAYDAVLIGPSGAELSRYPFWVVAAGAKPAVAVSKRVYAVGEPIVVTYSNAPGNRWDWVAIYREGADPNVAPYLTWAYTDAGIDGSVTLDRASNGPWPLRPGRYSAYLLIDDLYVKVAATSFTIGA